jgi:hypothetical protein
MVGQFANSLYKPNESYVVLPRTMVLDDECHWGINLIFQYYIIKCEM